MNWGKFFGLGGQVSSSQQPSEAGASAQEGRPPDAIVIGGGIAGLACARALGRNGKRVLLLEARPRLGGRIHTALVHGARIDLGASWIHGGKKHNPIRQLAEQAGARLIPTDYESLELYDLDGRELKDREHDVIDSAVDRALEDLLRAKRSAGRDDSIEPILNRALQRADLSPTERRGLRWALTSEIASEYAADAHDLSLSQWDEDEEYGGKDYQFAGGCSVLIDFLEKECRGVGVDIRTNAVVQSIDWSQDDVRVDTEEHSFQAKRVVVALPLGVLKRGAVSFRGALPDGKRRAIERLGIGTLNKVVMLFRKQFWEDEAGYFGCLGEQDEMRMDYWNLEPVTGEPFLAALVGGAAGIKLEDMSEAEVRRAVLGPLQRVFGAEVGEPVVTQTTRWTNDQFSHGSYSYVSVGGSYGDYQVLAEPLARRLFFAGEATSLYYPSTLHGAYESGERAAREALA